MTSQPDDPIDALVEACILALEDGNDDAIDDIARANPEFEAAFRERVEQLRAVGLLHRPEPDDLIPERLGEFRLGRQIGHGGMGAVFLARQESLERDVALKLIRPEHVMFAGARDRFRREMLAVARLSHPGIVPILTTGEASGVPYYAMELVHGASLAEVLEELAGEAPAALDGHALRRALTRRMRGHGDSTPIDDAPVFSGSWVQVCCRLLHDVANALAHAHERGVLHRDLKPSNILLTTTGEARLIDFGLAAAEGDRRLTRTGASFGSVPYMAPEQIRGDMQKVDARTDVYGLGVTLYELLTLVLPFGNSASTFERVVQGVVEPTIHHNPHVHPDVDAICLKAMDVDRARRYATVQEFGDDLLAFLGQRSVRARRPSTFLRLRRWAARNPRRAALTAIAFVVLVPGPLLFAWQRHVAAAEVRDALAIAEANMDQALAAVDQMLVRTAEARLAEIPRTARLREQLLQDAVAFHERLVDLANRAGDTRRARIARARSHWRLGSLQSDLGNLDEGVRLLETARAELGDLLATTASNEDAGARVELITELARCCERLAAGYGLTARPEPGEPALRQATRLYREADALDDDPRWRQGALGAEIALAMAVGRQGRFDDAAVLLSDLEERLADPESTRMPEPARLQLWAQVADSRGMLAARTGDSQDALTFFELAVERLERIPAAEDVDDGGRDPRVYVDLLARLAKMHAQRRQFQRSNEFANRALTEYERLARREPDRPRWLGRTASMLATRASNQRQLGDPADALPDYDRAIRLLVDVVKREPGNPQHRTVLALTHATRADARLGARDHDGALADFAAATALLEAALEELPDKGMVRSNLMALRGNHAQALVETGDLEGARGLLDVAMGEAETRTDPEGRRHHIELLDRASDLASRTGDNERAEELAEEATERARKLLADRPDDPVRQITFTLMSLNHGIFLAARQRSDEARELWENALPVARQAAEKVGYGRRLLGLTMLRLAHDRWRADDIEGAKEWFVTALQESGIEKASLSLHPEIVEMWESSDFRDVRPPAK